MAEVFHERFVVRGRSPIPLANGFKKAIVRAEPPSVYSAAAICRTISSLLGHDHCSAFSPDGNQVIVVFESSKQKSFVSLLKSRLESSCRNIQKVSIDTEDEEVNNGLLLREAIHWAFVKSMMRSGWTPLQNILVSGFVVGSDKEGLPLETISLDIQLELNDDIVLLVSPDVAGFHLAKPAERLPEVYKKQFKEGKFISVEDYCWKSGEMSTSDFECCVLPSMRRGYILGFCKSSDENMELQKQLWNYQCGIQLPADYYYIKVCFSVDTEEVSWYPSCLVLTRAGFVPVVASVRCSKILQVAQHFIQDAKAWDFFNAGRVEFEELQCESGTLPWIKVTNITNTSSHIPLGGMDFVSFSDLEPEVVQRSLRAKPIRIGENLCKSPDCLPATTIPLEKASRKPLSTISANQSLLFPKFTRVKPSIMQDSNKKRNREDKPIERNVQQKITKRATIVTDKPKERIVQEKPNKPASVTDQAIKKISERPGDTASKIALKQVERDVKNNGDDETVSMDPVKTTTQEENSIDAAKKKSNAVNDKQPTSVKVVNSTDVLKKKHKTVDNKAAPTAEAIESLIMKKHSEGKLKDLNVPDLKNFLRLRKAKVTGKKEDLIQRIQEML